ncbi:hypothetical protein [Sphingomonas sp.]|uniref:hypothetical protein n=1 Tax=Sphingomonas sp. TaxID=28214 RepID=UPI003566E124
MIPFVGTALCGSASALFTGKIPSAAIPPTAFRKSRLRIGASPSGSLSSEVMVLAPVA